jgi:putative CocE/NonD family hydrolase
MRAGAMRGGAMRGAFLSFAALLLALCAPAWVEAQELQFQAPASASDAAVPRIMRDLAERLLPVYQEPDQDRYLANLSALQMAAGDYVAADATRESLRERRKSVDSGRPVGRGTIYDVYAHAKSLETEDHLTFDDAFERTYEEASSRLSDHDVYAVEEWLQASPQEARDNFQSLLAKQRPIDTINEEDAINLVWAYLAFEAYRSFSPLVAALESKDDARRYVADDEIVIPVPWRPTLHVRVVRPKSASGPLASLLELSIDPSRNFAKEYAAHGYAGVAAYMERSRAIPFVPYQHDGEEARAIILWIAKQPWSDGRVAMVGEGYSGFTAWAAAAHPPAPLKAIATSAPYAPGIDRPMVGGIFENSAYRWSLQVTNTTPLEAGFADEGIWRALNEKWYRSGRPYRDLGRIFGRPNPIFIRWLNHPSYDRFWQTMVPFRQQFAHLDIPILTTTGYFDDSEPAALYYFAEHQRYDAHADHTLLIGPYDDNVIQHGSLTSPLLRDYAIDPAARVDLRELRYQWLDHALKGAALPPQLSGRINYEVMGANEWQHAASFAALAAESQRYYLDASASGPSHRLSRRKNPKLAAIAQSIRFKDRSDAGWLPPNDLISKSLVTHNAVLYQSDPLPKATRMSGLITGRLDFVVNKMDVDLGIAMYEQRSSGEYLRLFNPADELRLSYAADRVHRHLLKAGERQQLAFSSERMTSRQLEQGSRLVMVLRIGKRPDREINYGTGGDVSEESIADGKVPLKIRWFNDSYIDVPVQAIPH